MTHVKNEIVDNTRDKARAAVKSWPPLTPEQREALTDLLSPYAPEVRRAA